MTIDTEKIKEAILGTNCSPIALEEGSNLIDHWIQHNATDSERKIVAVETGFVNWLDEATVTIGVQDLLTDENGILGNEWKTCREKNKFFNEEIWKEEISDGPQLAIYAMALRAGTYYEFDTGAAFQPHVELPRIRVRAISKSAIPVCWPTTGDHIVTFTQEALENTRKALLVKAESIRAMRKTKYSPWQIPGIWCTNKFRRLCQHHEDCVQRKGPEGYGVFDSNDPAYQLALPHLGDRANDPDTVVLSASSYSTASECAEKYRRGTLSGDAEESLALAIGTVLHAGVSSWYKIIREAQNAASV